MSQPSEVEFLPVEGEELSPAIGKLLVMLLVFALMIPGGALAAYFWWYQVPLHGMVLSAKAGIVGLLAIPVAMFLVLVMALLLAGAKRLVIGKECVQLLSRGRVAVQIPFRNVAAVYADGEGDAGVVGLHLRDRNDPATRVPSWTKDRYEIQVLTYGKPLTQVHGIVKRRFEAFKGTRLLSSPRKIERPVEEL